MLQCVEENNVSVDEVEKCYTSQEGYMMMLNAEKETNAMTDGPSFVPTIVFDDVRNYLYYYLLPIYNISINYYT